MQMNIENRATQELRQQALFWLCEPHAANKAAGVLALGKKQDITVDTIIPLTPSQAIPGRPAKPELVSPLNVPKRNMRTVEGRAGLIHAMRV